MSWQYQTPDGEKFLRELAAKAHVAEEKDIPNREADQYVEEITEEHKEDDEDKREVKKFRIVEHWSCERSVTVKAVDKDHAEERAEEALLGADLRMSHKVHTEMDELSTVDEVPRSKIESGEYFEEADADE